MTPQELKNSILQLAIQGKLVEQRPEEGTAEELYNRLKAEKASGIKKGLWGKSKSLTEIEDGEILFEIPDSWRWIKIGEIASVVTKGTTPRGGNVSYLDEGIGFLRAENVAGLDKIDKTNLKCVDIDTHVGFLKRSIIHANDILITIAGTLGRTALVRETDLPLNVNQAVSIVRLVNTQDISLLFFIYALNSTAIQRYLTGQKKITAIPNLTLEIIENCLIPLPPLAEQKRIVAKIEELLPLIERYEKAWSRLEDFNKRFPGDMQKSILQMAIQGKLVKQRPEEGTGKELYRQIQAEKQALIKAGKIKKEKPLPEIAEDEIPFEIPESWKWVRLCTIGNTQTGNTPSKAHPEYLGSVIPFITPGDILNGSICYSNQALSSLGKEVARVAESGTILQVCIGGSIGKAAVTNQEVTFNQQINSIKPLNCIPDYVYSVMTSQSFIKKMKDSAGGTATPIINRGLWDSLLIPLPPLAEQKRIVARLEELLPLCERLK